MSAKFVLVLCLVAFFAAVAIVDVAQGQYLYEYPYAYGYGYGYPYAYGAYGYYGKRSAGFGNALGLNGQAPQGQ
uniref:Uncharacterized protein n=1 Tax=Panagrellus redivivus TaxID=6233 RepID=A0A7E4V5B1_PANRE